jgi:two-component system nitrate/nitrite response regulator NarL
VVTRSRLGFDEATFTTIWSEPQRDNGLRRASPYTHGASALRPETFLLPARTGRIPYGILLAMTVRCLLVDDSTHFLEAASKLLERQGLAVVGVASTSSEASARVRELEPDVTIVDINLNGESGFDLAWELAASSDGASTGTVLTSTRSELDFAELVAVTPALGFISKDKLSAEAIRDFLADRSHGGGCRHEALLYSSTDELAAGAVPFLQHGLSCGEDVLVVMREAGRIVLQQALGEDSAHIEFADANAWYRSPEHAFESYTRSIEERLERGAPRVRVVAEVVWPESSATADVARWKRYEAGISAAMASVAVSFICAYDSRELPAGIVTDARRTHPILRSADGARPSAHYVPPGAFIRDLER